MNNEERSVYSLVVIARNVEATLGYLLPTKVPFSYEDRKHRYEALTALTSKGTAFDTNCDNNGENGNTLKEDMHYFIEDVYSDNGRIVSVDINNNVQVEKSLTIELYQTIIKLRAYLEAFLVSALKFLKKNNKLDDDFAALVYNDIRFFHASASRVGCMLITDKFIELNKTVNTYAESYSKEHNGIDPRNDPEFNPENDPSFRMNKNEFQELNKALVTALNGYNNPSDDEYNQARQNVIDDFDIFNGKKETSDMKSYFEVFHSYFDRLIKESSDKLNEDFNNMTNQLKAFEEGRRSALNEAEKAKEDTKVDEEDEKQKLAAKLASKEK